ncbi:MAG: alternative ribosome rescue aminoacyl-tRNA hydrolase ArfB [Acidobacteriota bacterium]
MIEITDDIAIDPAELSFVANRSSGPGGQHVNKVATRITLRFDLDASDRFDEAQKALIRQRLATRINKQGILSVSSQRHRSQSANRDEALERFVELVQRALEVDPERRKTRTPSFVRRKRLENKRRRSKIKKDRSRNYRDHE